MLSVAVELNTIGVPSVKSADLVPGDVRSELACKCSGGVVKEVEIDLMARFPDHR